jgi:hypothetical protein
MLSDNFFDSVRKKELTKEDENILNYLEIHRKVEDPMIRIVAQKV